MSEFDYIIVGSGSAGGLLTLRLSENPDARVLLLEAGKDHEHWSTRMPAASRNNYTGGPRNWCFETDPEPFLDNRKLFQPRGKIVGGSSSLNGMVFVRGNPGDFDGWARSGAEGWSYEDVLPYFKRMERYAEGGDAYRGDGGPIVVERLKNNHPIENAFLAASAQAGFPKTVDYNGAEQEGVTAFDANIDSGHRSASAAACVRPAGLRGNVTIRAEAHVTRVLLTGTQAVGVEYLHRGVMHTVTGDEIILCAGAFQSPQILMLSGIGPADELRAHGISPVLDLPGVGGNLQDHLEVHVKHRCPAGLSKNGLLRKDRLLAAGNPMVSVQVRVRRHHSQPRRRVPSYRRYRRLSKPSVPLLAVLPGGLVSAARKGWLLLRCRPGALGQPGLGEAAFSRSPGSSAHSSERSVTGQGSQGI